MPQRFNLDPEAVRHVQREVKALYDIQLGDIFAADLTQAWYDHIDRGFLPFLKSNKSHIEDRHSRERVFDSTVVFAYAPTMSPERPIGSA